MRGRKKPWNKQERDLSREGARRVAASGAGSLKGDNKGLTFLVQCKQTLNQSFSLKISDFQKALLDARVEDRLPVLQIEIMSPANRFAVLRWEDFKSILEDAGIDL